MSIHEEQIEGAGGDTPNVDNAEFEAGWDELAAKDASQPADAAGREAEEGGDDAKKEPGEAGQGEAEPGDGKEAGATPGADAGKEPASRGETTDEIDWASVPEHVRKAYEASEEARKKAENLARSNGARQAQALHQLNELKAQLDSQRDAGGATQEGKEATDKQERLKQLREEYPDVAGPLLDQMAELESTVAKLKDAHTSQEVERTEAFYTEQATELAGRHSDMGEIVLSREYAEWLAGQPPSVHAVIEQNKDRIVNAVECDHIFTRFKNETGWGGDNKAVEDLASKRKRQLEAGTQASVRTPQVRRDDGDASFEAEWDRLAAKERRRASV